MRCFILTLTLLGSFLCSLGEEYIVSNLTTKNGLPSNRVYSVQKDSKGFIWFCTDMGVCRYNGMTIETFTTSDGLADNDVFDCFEDKWGRMWFATYNGELSFFQNNSFYNKSNCDWLQAHKPSGFIQSFIQRRNSKRFKIFHLISGNSYWEIDSNSIQKKTIPIKRLKKAYPKLSAFSLKIESNEHHYFYAYDNTLPALDNLVVIHEMNGKYEIIASKASQQSLTPVVPITGKGYWLNHGGKVYSTSSNKYLNHSIKQNEVYAILEEENGLLIGTKNGLQFQNKEDRQLFMKGKHITGIARGFANQLYVTTYKQGVFVLNGDFYTKNKGLDIAVRTLVKNNHTYLADKKNNLFRLKSGTLRQVNLGKNLLTYDLDDSLSFLGLIHDTLISISAKNKIAFCHNGKKISNFNFSEKLKGRLRNGILSKTIIFQNKLYIGDTFWLNRLDLKLKKLIGLYGYANSTSVTASNLNRILRITNDDNLMLALLTRNKFYQVKDNGVHEYKHLSKLGLIDICFIHHKLVGINKDNELLFVTNYAEPEAQVKRILFPEKIAALKKIKSNQLIFRTPSNRNWILDLSEEQPKIRELVSPLKSALLSNINSDSISIYLTRENKTTLFPLSKAIVPEWQPKIYLKQITGNNIKQNDSLTYTLSFKDKENVKITYLPINKHLTGELAYEYSLSRNKLDTNWTSTPNPILDLISLQWGEYHVLFRVKSVTNNISNIIYTKLTIQKPYYLSWWFILFILAGIAGFTYVITKRIQKTKQKKALLLAEDEKKFIQAEFKSLNALMNPHFIFNSLNNIQGFINTGSKENANKYLEIFAQLVRQNMHNIKDGSISLEKEMNLVRNYLALEKMRFKEKIRYKLNIDDSVELEDIFIPPLTIQPIIENSIKHGILPLKNRIGEIEISLSQIDNHLKIEVSDNGVGLSRDKKSAGNHIALETIKERFVQIEKITGYPIEFNIQNRIKKNGIIGTIALISIQLEDV